MHVLLVPCRLILLHAKKSLQKQSKRVKGVKFFRWFWKNRRVELTVSEMYFTDLILSGNYLDRMVFMGKKSSQAKIREVTG